MEPTHGTNTRNQHRESTHGATTGNQHTEPTQGTSTRNQHMKPSHGANTRSQHGTITWNQHTGTNTRNQHMEPTHGANAEPTHGTSTRSQHTEPTCGANTWNQHAKVWRSADFSSPILDVRSCFVLGSQGRVSWTRWIHGKRKRSKHPEMPMTNGEAMARARVGKLSSVRRDNITELGRNIITKLNDHDSPLARGARNISALTPSLFF